MNFKEGELLVSILKYVLTYGLRYIVFAVLQDRMIESITHTELKG